MFEMFSTADAHPEIRTFKTSPRMWGLFRFSNVRCAGTVKMVEVQYQSKIDKVVENTMVRFLQPISLLTRIRPNFFL